MAEERAAAAMVAAHETVCGTVAAWEAAVARAATAERQVAVEREAAAQRETAAGREPRPRATRSRSMRPPRRARRSRRMRPRRRAMSPAREAALHAWPTAARDVADARDEAQACELAELRGRAPGARRASGGCAAELEHLRRERSEHEERLRAELDRAHTEKQELRTRLSLCEHALAERERDLERERQLADEAMRWASSVERELVLPKPSRVQAVPPPAGDCNAKPPAEPPITALRRRGSRVRLRPAS